MEKEVTGTRSRRANASWVSGTEEQIPRPEEYDLEFDQYVSEFIMMMERLQKIWDAVAFPSSYGRPYES
eukprot:12374434-Karenia_brevis.AAC.1